MDKGGREGGREGGSKLQQWTCGKHYKWNKSTFLEIVFSRHTHTHTHGVHLDNLGPQFLVLRCGKLAKQVL